MDARDRQEMERQINQMREEIRALTRRTPARWARPADTPVQVQLIYGQLINSVYPVIEYAADPITAPYAYDPNSDTSYIAGLGNAWLYDSNGQPTQRVLVRNNWSGTTYPLASGNIYQVGALISVPVSGGGIINAYPIIGRL